MKKSNKLLLGGFLFVILLITGLHVTLYAKYKNGHYTVYAHGYNSKQASKESFPNTSIVSVHSCNATIEFGDVLSVQKDSDGFAEYTQQGDSLIITATSKATSIGSQARVKLMLPYNATVTAFNSNLSFRLADEKSAINPVIFLKSSIAAFGFPGEAIQLDRVKIIASDHSSAVFQGNATVAQLEVELDRSILEYSEGEIGQLSVVTDSTSQLMLQSKHLLKAKITPATNNP